MDSSEVCKNIRKNQIIKENIAVLPQVPTLEANSQKVTDPTPTFRRNVETSSIDRILILTPFKVGSSSIDHIFKKHKIDCIKVHGYGPDTQMKYPIQSIDGLIFIHRTSLDRYISAFFEDCSQLGYPYYYGSRDKVLSASIDDLILHFESFQWTQYDWLNYDFFIRIYKQIFKVDVDQIYDFLKSDDQVQFKVITGHNGHSNIPCLLLKTKFLDNSCDIIKQTFNIPVTKMIHGRQGIDKWYKSQYVLFKKKILERIDQNAEFYQKLIEHI